MDKVRYGVVGYGNMGSSDAKLVRDEGSGAVIAAVCDTNPERLEAAKKDFGSDLPVFSKYEDMLKSGKIDAAYIATPHYDHPEMVQQALKANLHALCEKPAGVYTQQVQDMYNAIKGRKNKTLFAMMFNQRPHPAHQKIKNLLDSGALGQVLRINWIITNWFRTQSYYNSGGWRATWKGEGGGVLINQCPHQLDLWQWFFGLPQRVRAFCGFGKYHDIEVEDDVTAYMEYKSGATGVFITTTGEAPGTNRLEVTTSFGKLVFEDGKLKFIRTEQDMREFCMTNPGGFASPPVWNCEIPVGSGGFGHKEIHVNFVNAILKGEKLIAQGEEGINGLTLGNAMLLSAWTDDWASLPLDGKKFLSLLQKRVKDSKSKKDPKKSKVADLAGSSSL